MTPPPAVLLAAAGLLLATACVEQPPSPVVYRDGARSRVVPPPAQRPPQTAPAARPRLGHLPPPGPRPAVRPEPAPPAPAARPQPPPPASQTGPRTLPASLAETTVVLVAEGDTLFSISRRHDVPLRTLIEANGLSPPYVLITGQPLAVPRARVHVVNRGETLYGVSRQHGADVYSLAQLNALRPPYVIYPGQRLTLPRPSDPAPAGPVLAAAPPSTDAPAQPALPSSSEVAVLSPPAADGALVRAAIPSPPPRAGRAFLWPAEGDVISGFGRKEGGRHNDGINIALSAGTPIRAAENGVVVYAGNELRGYGNLLLIRHSDGWMTAYAHASRLLVNRGDTVRRGQAIAEAGATGSVAQPQLHFEIRRGAQAVDPMRHLGPAGGAGQATQRSG